MSSCRSVSGMAVAEQLPWIVHNLKAEGARHRQNHHVVHDDIFFNYYMKVYFKYFNLNYPISSNKYILSLCLQPINGFLMYDSLCRCFMMNRCIIDPESCIYAKCRNNYQYPAFLKMMKADGEGYMAFLGRMIK